VTQAVNGVKSSKPKLHPPGQREERDRQPEFERHRSILKKGHALLATTETLSAIFKTGSYARVPISGTV
jgi:hypothetical protein